LEPNQNNQNNRPTGPVPKPVPATDRPRRPVLSPKLTKNEPSNWADAAQPDAKSNRPGQKPGGQPRPGGGGGGRGRRRGQQQTPSHTDLVPALDTTPVNKSVFNGAGGEQQTKRKANQPTKRETKLRVMWLGGLGEIAKNMCAVEYGNDIVIVDMGFGFPDEQQPGVDYIIPDVTYLERNKHKVRGIVITHAHLDHIGASGYMIPKFPVPVYGSRLSCAMVAKQIEEFKIRTPQFVILDPEKHERVQLGVFGIELIRVNHTIADATAVALYTPVGVVIDTGDWRIDTDPYDGKPMDMARFKELGDKGVLLMMSDSTRCDAPGRTPPERVVEPTINDLFKRADGRVIISAFSSSISRMQMIINAANANGRKLALVGRSLLANVELCVKLGYLRMPQGLLIRAQDINTMPNNQIVVLCTGSQGEENSALVRMSTGDHQSIKIKTGDSIIFSSSMIPGNDVKILKLIDSLMREGAYVYTHYTAAINGHGPLHIGGHAYRDEVGDLIRIVRPKYFMPIHGEFHHLVYAAEVAVENGVPRENVFVMDNGDVLELTESNATRGERIPAGMVMVDGAGIGDVEGMVLRDRLAMSGDGVFMIVATVSRKTGKLVSSPDIISRGFIYMKENEELINKARAEVRKQFEKRNPKEPIDWAKFKLKLRDEVGDVLYAKTKRNPMILPVINEV
jgi:ribonuclease J